MEGGGGGLFVRVWENEGASFIVLLVHGYASTSVVTTTSARRCPGPGPSVRPGPRRSRSIEGERVLIEDIDRSPRTSSRCRARAQPTPGPAAGRDRSLDGRPDRRRDAQLYHGGLEALAPSAPAIASNPAFETVVNMDPMPEIALDPDDLSRDPEVGAAYAADPLVWHGPFKPTTLGALLAAGGAVAEGPAVSGTPALGCTGPRTRSCRSTARARPSSTSRPSAGTHPAGRPPRDFQ